MPKRSFNAASREGWQVQPKAGAQHRAKRSTEQPDANKKSPPIAEDNWGAFFVQRHAQNTNKQVQKTG